MRSVEIIGYGTYLPKTTVEFGGQIRYRIGAEEEETQLSMAVGAVERALASAKMTMEDMDLIVSTSAVPVQPIPCTAALIHEQLAKGTDIPAMDINTTCTSFVTALDVISYLMEAGRYEHVVIVASELASCGLNSNQKESYELFSDGAAAVVLGRCKDETAGILYGMQKTWSEGAHATEIRGGLTGLHPKYLNEDTKEDFMFDMKGVEILSLAAKKLPPMINEFLEKSGLTMEDIDFVIPHQASKALGMVMRKMGVPKGKYLDIVSQYGNMVSASIPFALCKALEEKYVQKGDIVLLCGTAAGLTSNLLALRY